MNTHSHPHLSYLSNLLHSRQPDRQAAERETRNTRYEIENSPCTLPPAVSRSTKNKNKQKQQQITSTVHSFVRLDSTAHLSWLGQVRSGQVPLRYPLSQNICKYVLSV